MARRRNNSSPRSKAGPVVTGASSGTLFLLLAKGIPDKYGLLKQTAIYLAPTVSVCAAAIVAWLREYINEVRKNRLFDSAQKKLEAIMNNKHTSPQEKERITQKLAELQALRTDSVLEVVQRDM